MVLPTSPAAKVVAPSRARGLKHRTTWLLLLILIVAPSRARGLKRTNLPHVFSEGSGRALTGAWIETHSELLQTLLILRRALTGAWIETRRDCDMRLDRCVAPSRARGLKLEFQTTITRRSAGRALTGAWIETT